MTTWSPSTEESFLAAASRVVPYKEQWWVDCGCERLTSFDDWKEALKYAESGASCEVCQAQEALKEALSKCISPESDVSRSYAAGRLRWEAQQQVIQESINAGHDFSYMMLPPTRESVLLMSPSSFNRKMESWAKAVKDRDGWCCSKCGESEKSQICAHHIVGRAQDLYLALDLNNGITLCVSCHEKEHH